MIKALAFFPWWRLDEAIDIGNIRLLPYVRGSRPGNLPEATQKDIDDVLGAYATRPNKRVREAVLVEVDGWLTGQDPESVIERLFAARNALGFAGLASRSLFRGHTGYCCFDTFSLVVQRYREGDGTTFAYSTRRRDGGTSNVWASDEFAFHLPAHVSDGSGVPLDAQLTEFLFDRAPAEWVLAIEEFNRANTDSSDLDAHSEMVMTKSAWEWLWGIGEKKDEFRKALAACLADLPTPKKWRGPLLERWRTTWPHADRPLDAWAREFCARRGASAHGARREANHYVWTVHAHLAFASVLFPLVVKKMASDRGLYALSPLDRERLLNIDAYVLHDPFQRDRGWHENHPWQEIEGEFRIRTLWHRL